MRQLRPTAGAGVGVALLLACLAGCVTPGGTVGRSTATAAGGAVAAAAGLSREDIEWLGRVGFGVNTATLIRYRELGRQRYLDDQLSVRDAARQDAALPSAIALRIGALHLERNDPVTVLREVAAENQRIAALNDGPDREQARKNQNERANTAANAAIERDVLRGLYSPAQLQETMVWFWLNHFSVHQYKGNLRWLIGDYEEQAIRPHALGHFRDLVLATLEHPAMLQYLDNAQNAAGHINENYARELMELHTLGVTSGYGQRDVQELARILTGVGINHTGETPHLRRELESLYVRRGAFEFNPARHDFGGKVLLGQTIPGRGWPEVEQAVTWIVQQPACAQFISRKLASYFVSEQPPAALVAKMAQSFQHSDGDISAVLHTLFQSPEFLQSLGTQFKDPRQFVFSAMRLAYDGQSIDNTRPVLNWLNALGEPPYGRVTPDGYAVGELAWASSGQLSRRFEIAKAIGSGNANLFDPEDGSAAATTGFPRLMSRLYYDGVEPYLSARTKEALGHASSQQEWNTFLLSAPEFNYH